MLLLLAILRLHERAYGVTIRLELDRVGRHVAVGAIYTGLDRLERRGLVKSWVGEATPQRGGRAKRLYEVTQAGRFALRETQSAITKLSTEMNLQLDHA